MEIKLLPCPLCLNPQFDGVDTLRTTLIRVATTALACPVCNEMLIGLDKLTIHLFSHMNNVKIIDKTENEKTNNLNTCQDMIIQKSATTKNTNQNQTILIENNITNQKIEIQQNVDHNMEHNNLNIEQNRQINNREENIGIIQNIIHEPSVGMTHDNLNIEENISINHDVPMEHNVVIEEGKTTIPVIETTNSIRCDICNILFNDETILEMHQKLVHPTLLDKKTGTWYIHCHLCTRKYKMRGCLKLHLQVAHGFGHRIDENQTKTNSNESMQGIYVVQNSPENTATRSPSVENNNEINIVINCEESNKTQQLVKDNKQWECEVCSKMFTTKYFLKKHKRLHTGEMPYFCNLCNKSFTFQQSYHKHMLYHTAEKPHICSECGRAFKELSTLHNHERIHSGERPFACETCGKRFRQRVSYLVHRRIHTGVMPYKCTACDKSFRYKVSQRSHKCTANPPGTVIRASEVQSNSNDSIKMNNEINKSIINQYQQNNQQIVNNQNNRMNNVRKQQLNNNLNNSDKSMDEIKVTIDGHTASDNLVNGKTLIFNVGQTFSFVPGCDIIIQPNPITAQSQTNVFQVNDNNVCSTSLPLIPLITEKEETRFDVPMNQTDISSPNNQTTFEAPDFFSMVRNSPPMLPDVQSLHLDSPENPHNDNERILETINEESLKELLYGSSC